jgi:hypothetical protein
MQLALAKDYGLVQQAIASGRVRAGEEGREDYCETAWH